MNGQALAGRDGFRAGLSRSARLLLAFRTEQSDPSGFYTLVAADAVAQLGQYTDLRGKTVIDVGGGPGFFARALRAAGARACCVDTSLGELAAHGAPGPGAVAGSALRLPVASGSADVCFSANVLEHVGDWRAMLAEMVRVTRPGGVIFVSYTNWCRRGAGTRHRRGTTSAASGPPASISGGTAGRTGTAPACTRSRWPPRCAGPGRRTAWSWRRSAQIPARLDPAGAGPPRSTGSGHLEPAASPRKC